jgi:uncharacterized protein HemX
MIAKILIGVIVALVLAFGGYYWLSERKIERLTENNAALTIASTTNQETIDQMIRDNKAYELANAELQVKLRASESYGDVLREKLRTHNLTMLTLRKPGLIETRVNNATEKLFEDFESSTATVDPE